MKKDIKNIQASVRARLQNKAKETNRPFSEILQYYGMERFLYRFSRSKYSDRFILKGALMFTVWQVPERRTTLDIDFLARYDNQITTIEKVIKDTCEVPVTTDGLVFDSKTVKGQKIKEDADYEGVRLKIDAALGQARKKLQMDIGFGDVITPRAIQMEFPTLLEGKPPTIRAYSIESIISEKFEAMVKLGLLNSRMKDFYDTWLMMRQFDFNGSDLAEALKRTFDHRKTPFPQDSLLFAEEIYDEKSDRQTLWKTFLKKGDIKHAPEKLSATVREIEELFIGPLNAINKGENFNAEWKARGPWK